MKRDFLHARRLWRRVWNWLAHSSQELPRFFFRWKGTPPSPARRIIRRTAAPLDFESLERRALLTSWPIALPDLTYQPPTGATQFSANAASGLLANDYDPDTAASSLRVQAAWVASGGTLTWAPDGSFTFTRAANFSGIASFFYQTSDGQRISYPAEVNIAFDAPFSPNLLASEHASGNLLHAGVWTTQMQATPDWSYTYRTDTVDPAPVLAVETNYAGTPAGRSVTSIRSELFRGGTRVATATYTDGLFPLAAGTRLRFALQDGQASALPTGRYDYSFRLTVNYENQTSRAVDYSLSKSIVNRSNEGFRFGSQFGQGWWLEGLDQLYTQSNGALWVQSNGDAYWFAQQPTGYATAPGDTTLSTLTRPGNANQFVLTDKWGNTKTFELGTSGNLARLMQVKALNNVTPTWRYFYDTTGRLTTIRDEFNRAWQFQQTGGFTTGIVDFTGRTSTMQYNPVDPGVLISCRWPIPGVTPDPALQVEETRWLCGVINGWLDNLTDPRGGNEKATYSAAGLVERLTHGDNTSVFVSPMLQQGLAAHNTLNATLHVVYDAPNGVSGNWPWIRSERGQTSYFKTNEFGAVTRLVDADGHRSDWDYSNRNLLYRLTGADPDGPAGQQSRPVTQLGHSYWDNVVFIRNSDNTTRSATWHATFNRPLSITNELGQVDRFGYDAAGNLLFQQDATNRRWDYVYDQTLASAADRHGRLLQVQSPDPDGTGPLPRLVTKYEYETAIWNRAVRVVNSDHTATAPSFRSFAYNDRDEVTSATNELGQTTFYTYDFHSRLRLITLPPDQLSSSGVIARNYNQVGQLTSEIDPLGNKTEYSYNTARGWLIGTKQLSAAGSLLAASTYNYYADGLLQFQRLPSYRNGASESYRYDGRGNLIEVTSPSGGVTQRQYDGLSRLVYTKDPFGREQRFVYDARDRLTEARDHDPDGTGPLPAPTTRYAYDAASRLLSETDPLGRATNYSYLLNGWLSSLTLPDPDGALGPATGPMIGYAYNNLGQVTQVTVPGGRVTDTTYDNRGRAATVTQPDPDGTGPLPRPQTRYEYDRVSRVTATVDHLSRRTAYAYDSLGRLTSVTLPDADGNAATTGDSPRYQYRYDLAGNLVATIDPLLRETRIEPDGLGRPARVIEPDADGNPLTLGDQPTWNYSYGDNSLLSSVTDPLNRVSNYEYDDFGRQTAVLQPAFDGSTSLARRPTVRYQYDSLDRLTKVSSDPDGFGSGQQSSDTDYRYDIYSRLDQVTDPERKNTQYGYDLAGQLISLRDPSGNETLWAYDGLGRQKFETNQLGHSRFFEYDTVGNLLRRTDRNGRLIQSTYDLLDRQTLETWFAARATNRVQTTREGAAGVNEIQTITFSGLSATNDKFQLAFGGEQTRILPFNASAAGVKSAIEELRDIDNVSVTMTTSGATRTYTVTFGGVLAGKNLPLIQAAAMPAVSGAQQGAVDYKYNSAGLLSEGGDSSARYTWAYDQLNRQTSETADLDPANPLNSIVGLTQAFNVAGKRIQLSARFTDFAAGGTVTTRPDFRSVFEYDNLDRLKSIQQTALGGANSNAVAPKFVDFSYNRLGQLTALSRFENTTATGPALRTGWTYDGANRLSQLKHESTSGTAATLLNQYSYTYDLMNRITGITSTLDGPSTFTYDRNSQLRGATHTAPRTPESYQYDANGNRTGGAQQVGVNNQTLADDKYTYQYDAEGNRTRRTERSSGAIEDYAWDHRNRLTRITFRTSAGVETRSIEYRYDLLNRLVLRRLDSNGAATSGGGSDLWLAGYDGISPTLALSSLSSTAVTNRYLWGPGVDFLLADEQVTTTSSPGNTLWPLGDHLGTLRDLADFTGGSFTITNHRVFDTFGRLLSETNSSVDSHFAFTGKFFEDLGDTDPTTSLSHHWNRWYDPQLGKWVSEDPIGFAGGDANLGRYVGNLATGAVDWSGWIVGQPFYPQGHHWIPVGVTNSFLDSLEPDAIAWAYGFTSGKLNEPHNFGSNYNGVSHSDYNRVVEKEMKKLVDQAKRQGRKVTRDEIVSFGGNLEQGLGAKGKPIREIGDFNRGVSASRSRWKQGGPLREFRVDRTDDYIEKCGRRCAGNGRYRRLLVGAGAMATIGSIFGNANAFAEEVKDENSKIRCAMRRIEIDDFEGARELLEQAVEEMQVDGLAGYAKEIGYKRAISLALDKIRDQANQLELLFGDELGGDELELSEIEEEQSGRSFGTGIIE